MSVKYKSDVIEWHKVLNLKNFLHIAVGIVLAVLAMKGFMIPNRLLDGGITGISILLYELFQINISFLVIGLNALFIYLGYRRIGKTFAVQTTIAVILLALALFFIDMTFQYYFFQY